ncbi:hypothetical protein HMPREF0682_1439 [Propionibacterium acidifaciens F0233]|uniref:Uncharacterized protein n=1 Tax=Propionibacterium acidifaciens F0233 TaxID=553198 RepID=U2PZ48_9ACTN|nr:hypothetical protein HMPREF0682_1439 [Propionibacterium acidifaciens F0233]
MRIGTVESGSGVAGRGRIPGGPHPRADRASERCAAIVPVSGGADAS